MASINEIIDIKVKLIKEVIVIAREYILILLSHSSG